MAKHNATQMRTEVGIAVVVMIGLIWSTAAMSKWVAVSSAEMTSAPVPPHATMVR